MHRDVGVLNVVLLLVRVFGVELLHLAPVVFELLQRGRRGSQLEGIKSVQGNAIYQVKEAGFTTSVALCSTSDSLLNISASR